MTQRKITVVFAFCILIFHALSAWSQTHPVVDMAGRTITVPQKIERVYCMNPACALLVYNIAPEKLVNWPIALNAEARQFLGADAKPATVTAFDRSNPDNTANNEEILRLHPDIVMFMANTTIVSRVDRFQAQTGLPTYVINPNLNDTPKVFEQLGYLLGEEGKAKQLAQYSRRILSQVEATARTIPQNQRKRLYYAQGTNGLMTFPAGAPHAQMIEAVGAINVANVPYGLGASQISGEQLIRWQPEVILAVTDTSSQSLDFYNRALWTDPLWQSLPAVRNHLVYTSPRVPFNWIDPPWSSNRILGLAWLAQTLYPNRYHFDLRKETREYYKLFYHCTLTDVKINQLLSGSKPR